MASRNRASWNKASDEYQEAHGPILAEKPMAWGGITLAHNTRSKAEVDEIVQRAERAGKILKKPQLVEWGGYSGYFSDPDGYLWEVAWSADWVFHEDGSLVIE